MNLELRRVKATDDINKSDGLQRVMQAGQDYLWPESAVASFIVEGLQRGAKYFAGSESQPLYIQPVVKEEVKRELVTLWRAVMKTDPAKYIREYDVNADGLTPGAYQPPNRKLWKGQPLDGKRVLLCGAYSIGDQLWYTHTLHLLKQKYPRAVLYVLTYAGYGDGIWAGNEDAYEIQLPVTPLAFEAFDFYIPLLSIVAANIDPKESQRKHALVQNVRTPYETFADLLGMMKEYDPSSAKPHVAVTTEDWRAMCVKITTQFFSAWATVSEPLEPTNYVVVQLHTQKESRDFTGTQLVDVLSALRAEYPHSMIFCIGDGEKGLKVWNAITETLDPEALKIIPLVSGTQAGSYTFRDLAALTAHAMLTVCPDSMLSHLSAAFDIPNVTVYGPYAAAWRAATYKYCETVEIRAKCSLAPCAWPGASFPEHCPSRAEHRCAVVTAATGADIISAARTAIDCKREAVPDFGVIRLPERIAESETLHIVDTEEVDA